jgi:septal ring factor EnvC (AmiA/AmiB activator)
MCRAISVKEGDFVKEGQPVCVSPIFGYVFPDEID